MTDSGQWTIDGLHGPCEQILKPERDAEHGATVVLDLHSPFPPRCLTFSRGQAAPVDCSVCGSHLSRCVSSFLQNLPSLDPAPLHPHTRKPCHYFWEQPEDQERSPGTDWLLIFYRRVSSRGVCDSSEWSGKKR